MDLRKSILRTVCIGFLAISERGLDDWDISVLAKYISGNKWRRIQINNMQFSRESYKLFNMGKRWEKYCAATKKKEISGVYSCKGHDETLFSLYI